MKTIWLDYETYSAADLKKFGVYTYTEDPNFEVLMCAYSLDGVSVELAVGELDIRVELEEYLVDPSILKVAQNCQFERIVTSRLIGRPTGEYLDPRPWHDTAAIAAEKGWPRSLAPLAAAMGGEQKDEAGTRLINLFCKPNRQGRRTLPEERPEEWEAFKRYCIQDVYTLIDAHRGLGDWPTEMEREVFMVDQAMNDRGVEIDLWMAREAVRCKDENAIEQKAEFTELSGVVNPNSQPQMMAWVREQGLPAKNLQASTVEALLDGELTDTQRRVLELRTDLALTASNKFKAALGGASPDGRLRGQFKFYGAHTGRWSGRGVQLQNLPRQGLPMLETNEAILTLKMGDRVDPQTLKSLVRPLLVGPFTVFDYSSIEARVIAWLADEKWALEAFVQGRDIYIETAERMSTPTKKLTRAHGKVAVLALGFAGGTNSLVAMGADGTKEELNLLVRQWRKANPKIVQFWSDLDEAIASGGMVGEYVKVTHTRNIRGVNMHVRLPSGRSLNYHGLRWQRFRVEVDGVPKMKEGWTYLDPGRPGSFIITYGGRLTENIVQAVARDIMAEAMVALERAGYLIVGTVHDELIIEGAHELTEVKRIMIKPPPWCPNMPIDAEGGHSPRYSK